MRSWTRGEGAACMCGIFKSLDAARACVERSARAQRFHVLAVCREPGDDFAPDRVVGYRFAGFDLIDETETSALTNCGGFEGAFEPSELTSLGLVADLARAREIQEALPRLYPAEGHAYCALWAVWVPLAAGGRS